MRLKTKSRLLGFLVLASFLLSFITVPVNASPSIYDVFVIPNAGGNIAKTCVYGDYFYVANGSRYVLKYNLNTSICVSTIDLGGGVVVTEFIRRGAEIYLNVTDAGIIKFKMIALDSFTVNGTLTKSDISIADKTLDNTICMVEDGHEYWAWFSLYLVCAVHGGGYSQANNMFKVYESDASDAKQKFFGIAENIQMCTTSTIEKVTTLHIRNQSAGTESDVSWDEWTSSNYYGGYSAWASCYANASGGTHEVNCFYSNSYRGHFFTADSTNIQWDLEKDTKDAYFWYIHEGISERTHSSCSNFIDDYFSATSDWHHLNLVDRAYRYAGSSQELKVMTFTTSGFGTYSTIYLSYSVNSSMDSGMIATIKLNDNASTPCYWVGDVNGSNNYPVAFKIIGANTTYPMTVPNVYIPIESRIYQGGRNLVAIFTQVNDTNLYVYRNLIDLAFLEAGLGYITPMPIPENMGVTISDMEGCGNWVFAEERPYHFEAQYRFAGNETISGYGYIDTVGINFSDGFNTIKVLYNIPDKYYKTENGSSVVTVLSPSLTVINASTINVTIPIYFLGIVQDSQNVSIWIWSNTTYGEETGWELVSPNYFNIYSKGGLTTYTFDGSGAKYVGGDAFEMWAGGLYYPEVAFWENFTGTTLMPYWHLWTPGNTNINVSNFNWYDPYNETDYGSMYIDGSGGTCYAYCDYGIQYENHTIQMFFDFYQLTMGGWSDIVVYCGYPQFGGLRLGFRIGNETDGDVIAAVNGSEGFVEVGTASVFHWYNLTILVDMTNEKYSAYLDTVLIVENFDMYPGEENTKYLMFTSTNRDIYVDTIKVWKTAETGGYDGTANAIMTYRNLQSVRMQYAFAIPHGDSAISYGDSAQGYVDFGLDFCDPITGEWVYSAVRGRISIVGSKLDGSNDWIKLNITWYDCSGAEVKNETIYAYWEGSNGESDYFRMWTDLWFNRINGSQVIGGRMNAFYYGMHDSSNPWVNWIFDTDWGAMIDDPGETICFNQLYGGVSLDTKISATTIKLMRINVTIHRNNDKDYSYGLKNWQVFDITTSKMFMEGVNTPVIEPTKLLDLNNNGILTGLWSAISSLGSIIFRNALLPFFDWMINYAVYPLARGLAWALDSLLVIIFGGAMGSTPFTDFLVALAAILASIPDFFSWFIAQAYSVLIMIAQVFLFLAEISSYLLYAFIHAAQAFINFIVFVVNFFTGISGYAIDLWTTFGMTAWVELGFILYPVWIFVRCDEVGSMKPLKEHIKMWADIFTFMVHLFQIVYQFSVDLVFRLIDLIPVVE